jgi:predicted acetyltransferase
VDISYRPVSEQEIPAFCRACAAGFGEAPDWFEQHQHWGALEPERTVAAFDGDDIVGTSRNFSLELTVPGGAQVPAAGVSAVAVLPTHTRRGILRSFMTMLLDDALARDEPVAMLTASEGGIYGRFGFGITIPGMRTHIRAGDVEFRAPPPAGQLRMVDGDQAAKIEPEVFDRARRAHPGAVSRPHAWWPAEQTHPSDGTRFDVVYEAPDGSVDGYCCYSIKEKWESGGAHHRLMVNDLIVCTPDAEHALWRHVCDVDLVGTVDAWHVRPDTPLPWMLVSSRAVQPTIGDFVWTRVLDVPAALGARTYAVAGSLSLEVNDGFRPGRAAHGAFTLDGGPDGAVVRSGGTPEISCDVDALSAAWLGGVRWSTLADAGRVVEHSSGAVDRADQMFASAPLPYAFTWF